MTANPQTVLNFWYDEDHRPYRFAKDAAFDDKMRTQFFSTWQAATRGELAAWRTTMDGRLAEILLLDQFSRNLARNTLKAFAYDGMALVLAREAVKQADFALLAKDKQRFIIMPYMHSESAAIHEEGLALFAALGDANTLEFERRHKAIIDRFGRYPHRNAILGRKSSDEELAFLKQPGSSF